MILEIIQNKIILVPIIAVIISQIIKITLILVKGKKVKFKEAIWMAGMPSSHSAFLTALIIAVGIKEGIASSLFGITLIFSLMYIFDLLLIFKILLIERVKELQDRLGHSLFQIIVGIIIGAAIALLIT